MYVRYRRYIRNDVPRAGGLTRHSVMENAPAAVSYFECLLSIAPRNMGMRPAVAEGWFRTARVVVSHDEGDQLQAMGGRRQVIDAGDETVQIWQSFAFTRG